MFQIHCHDVNVAYACRLLANSNSHLPGMTVMVFKARRTLKVLKTETFPKSTNSVKYLQCKQTSNLIISIWSKLNIELDNEATHAILMTMKSSQFQGSFRKVNFPTQKPLDRIFMVASNVQMNVNTYLYSEKKSFITPPKVLPHLLQGAQQFNNNPKE